MGTGWNYCRTNLHGVSSKHDAPLLSLSHLPTPKIQICIWGKKRWVLCLLGLFPGRGTDLDFHWCLLARYLVLISKFSCINHVESKRGWKSRRCVISLYLNLIYPSASRRKVLTFIFEGRTWAAGPELGCAGKRLSPALRRVS